MGKWRTTGASRISTFNEMGIFATVGESAETGVPRPRAILTRTAPVAFRAEITPESRSTFRQAEQPSCPGIATAEARPFVEFNPSATYRRDRRALRTLKVASEPIRQMERG